jgi:hypothetical protein
MDNDVNRFQEWERERLTWRRFRRLPLDFQAFFAIGVLGSMSGIALIVCMLLWAR